LAKDSISIAGVVRGMSIPPFLTGVL